MAPPITALPASWYGPATVTEHDGSTTKYTYAPTGAVATKIIYFGTSHSEKYAWEYDAAGHVVKLTTTAMSGNTELTSPSPVVNTYQYDSLGRITQEKDNDGGASGDPTTNRTTTYAYGWDDAGRNTQTITYPDGSVETITTNTDGSFYSDTGTAVTPRAGNEGYIATAGTDAYHQTDSNVTAGSTWVSVTGGGAGGSANTTTTYTNVLGQVYLVQKSKPDTAGHTDNAMADAMTSFDGNGRAIKYVDFDGTISLMSYDPVTGALASIVTDMNHDGAYEPGIDRKSVSKVSGTLPAAGSAATLEQQALTATGIDDQVDSEQIVEPAAT